MKVTDNTGSHPRSGVVVKQRTYESVIEELGGFGYWQRCIFLFLCIPDIFNGFAQMIPVYTGGNPGAQCASTNLTATENFYNETKTYLSDFNTGSHNTTMRNNVNEQLCGCGTIEFNKDFTSIVTEWELVCELDYVSDLIHSIQFTGMLVGALVAGQISDSFGRKKVLFFVVSFIGVGGFVSGLAPNWQTYACMRFLLGLGSGGYSALGCVYPLEWVSRKWRTFSGTIGFWAIAQMLLALMGYYIRNWRWLTLATSGIAICYVPFWWLIPESPRWLAQKGHIEEAEDIIKMVARKNKVPVPDLSVFRDKTSLRSNENEMDESKDRVARFEKWRKYTYLDLIRTKKMLVTTIAVMILWFVSYITYYFLAFNIKNLPGSRYLNLFVGAITDQVLMITVILVNNYMGRRKGFVGFAVGSVIFTIALVFILLFHRDGADSTLFTGVALVAKAIFCGACYVVMVFTAEVYPTCIRNCGVSAGQLLGRIGALLAPQIVYLATITTVAPYILITVITLVALPPCFLLPETRDRPLQDTLEIHHCSEDIQLSKKNLGNKC